MAKILIVDDSKVMQMSLKSICKELGHEVVGFAGNGNEAFKLYFELQPDIVTMDVNMPSVNGIDATKNIIEKDPKARIIMISTVDNPELRYLMLEGSGILDYIVKPVEKEALSETISSIMED